MRVAIVTPAYNVAAYIEKTIASVIAQSHPDWAMLVVDDGSTDNTAAIVAARPDPRLRLIRQPNAGVSAARNRGLADANADAILFLDADDLLTRGALTRLVQTLTANPKAVAAYGAYAYVTENASQITQTRSGPFPAGDILERLLEQNLFANGGHLLIRNIAIADTKGFQENIAYGEDWEYWTRLALAGPFATVPGAEPLLLVRQRNAGAYFRMASNPAVFAPCMEAIFANPALQQRFTPSHLAAIRQRTEAENAWIVGRELIRHGSDSEGRQHLRQSFAAKPRLKRLGLLAMAYLPMPRRFQGPFRRYPLAE